MANEMLNFAYEVSPSYMLGSVACHKSTTLDRRLIPFRRKACCGFLSPLKVPSSWAEFELANLGSIAKRDND
jgi:hypothetical protein